MFIFNKYLFYFQIYFKQILVTLTVFDLDTDIIGFNLKEQFHPYQKILEYIISKFYIQLYQPLQISLHLFHHLFHNQFLLNVESRNKIFFNLAK